ncbi:MAG: VCBS repeat-containing protein [Bacteroidales bacterium]|nr:VCBS repeat-containing protein [Bacteroidales bacterium]
MMNIMKTLLVMALLLSSVIVHASYIDSDSLSFEVERHEYDSIVAALYAPVYECHATNERKNSVHRVDVRQKVQSQSNTIPTVTINKSKAVGEIALASGVSQTGAKTYSVSIQVPSGMNGFQPRLSLEYNSQAGNSVVGVGWNISGLSSITRSSKSIYYDGKTAPVSMSEEDAFFLNGTRLIRLSKSSNVIEYEAEQGNVRARGYYQNHVLRSFEVFYPDGSKGTFGGPDNDVNRLVYPLMTLNDVCGNVITYSYNSTDNQYTISRISYNGSTIDFSYTDKRPDKLPVYRAGVKVVNSQLLKTISIRSGGSLLRTYSLQHTSQSDKSLLSQIDLSANGKSLNPLRFSYGNGDSSYTFSTSTTQLLDWYSSTDPNMVKVVRGRFGWNYNAEGLIVLPNKNPYMRETRRAKINRHSRNRINNLYSGTEKIFLYADLQADLAAPIPNLTTGAGFIDILCADIDGVHEDRIVKINNFVENGKESLVFTVYRSSTTTGISHQYTRTFTLPTAYEDNDGGWSVLPKRFFIGDFNGDGRQDIMAISADNVFADNSGGSICYVFDLPNNRIAYQTSGIKYYENFVGSGQPDPQDAANKSDKIFTVDFDGDGKTDLCHISETGTRVYGFDGSNFSLSLLAATASPNKDFLKDRSFLLGDFNGDGLVDIFVSPSVKDKYDKKWAKFISRGNGTFEYATFYSFANDGGANTGFFAHDVNNDGVTDVVSFASDNFMLHLTKNETFPATGRTFSFDKAQSVLIPVDVNSHSLNSKLVCLKDGKATNYSFKADAAKDLLLTQAVNSFGVIDQTKYTPLVNNGDIYSRGTGAKFPYINITEPLYVVQEEAAYANGVKIDNKRYRYTNAVLHLQGLGFRGFESLTVIDRHGGKYTTTYAPFNYSVPLNVVTPTSDTKYTYSHNVQSNKVLKTRLTKVDEKNLLTGYQLITTYEYDAYGYPLVEKRSFPDGISVKKESTYKHSDKLDNKYHLGYLERQKTTSVRNGTTIVEQYYTPVINSSVFRPTVAVMSKGGKQTLQHTYSYDKYGNVIQDNEHAYSGSTFTKKYEYDSKGQVTKTTDPFGLTSLYAYDSQGNVTTYTDSYGNETKYTYDAFGKETTRKTPDGVTRTTEYKWSDGVGLYEVRVSQNNAPETATTYDAQRRVVRQCQKRYSGNLCMTDYVYDIYGNLSKVSSPFQNSSTASTWTTYTYDSCDRILSESQPDGRTTTYKYENNVVTTIKDGVSTSRVYDSQGYVTKVTDPSGSVVFRFAPDGQPISITQDGKNLMQYTYDSYRRLIQVDDPNRGKTSYEYKNENVVKMTNAKGEVISYDYDKYNRITKLTCNEFIATYVYDDHGNLTSVTGSNGTSTTKAYDKLGRLIECKEFAAADKWLLRSLEYSAGHTKSITYTSANGRLAKEDYSYANGHLSTIKVGNDVVYALGGEDSMALPSSIRIGKCLQIYTHTTNGYMKGIQTVLEGNTLQKLTFDYDRKTGNLTSRTDNLINMKETFGYDNLNRLTSYARRKSTYAPNGNLLSKTDVGTLGYDDTQRQYAVTKVVPASDAIPLREQRVKYTSFSRPATIEENAAKATFTYNAAFDRVRMELAQKGTTTTRYYLGNCYEIEQTDKGITERLYLGGDYYTSNAVLCRENNTTKMLYLLRDNLGSINKIVDTQGNTLQELSYDAWGRLRNAKTQKPFAPGEEPRLLIGRGYTGHEHLTTFGLINMNARLYDPALSRFLSPDPYVQDKENPQNYNAYSYCLNNPLKYTDPTGKKWWHWLLGVSLLDPITTTVTLTNAVSTASVTGLADFSTTQVLCLTPAGTALTAAIPAKNYGNRVVNAAKIDFGMYKTDSDLKPGRRFWQFLSRTTWEGKQTYAGLCYSHGKNIAGCVNRVDYYGGATFCTNENSSRVNGENGITMGNYINININDCINTRFSAYVTRAHNGIYMHEYGHTLQSRNYGIFYLPYIGPRSLLSATFSSDHSEKWYEREASAYARRYFGDDVWTSGIIKYHPSWGFLCYDK